MTYGWQEEEAKRWKRLLRRAMVLLVLLLALGAAGFIGVNSLKAEYTVTYTGYNAAIGSISNSLSFSGSLARVNEQTCAAEAEGTVKAGDKLIKLSTGETLKADFDGTVNLMNVKKDDRVKAGETLCQLADFAHMSVSVRVDEYDIGSVKVGDACRVTVTAAGQA